LFKEFANAKPKDATVYATHSVTSAITHRRTKLQLLQSFHFGCNRKIRYKFEFNILSKNFPPTI